jgi:hypothetical protein
MPRKYDRDNKGAPSSPRARRLSGGELADDPLTSPPSLSLSYSHIWPGRVLLLLMRGRVCRRAKTPGQHPEGTPEAALRRVRNPSESFVSASKGFKKAARGYSICFKKFPIRVPEPRLVNGL